MALDEAAMAELERLYCEGELTLVELGARFGRSPSGISRLARSRGWPMRWDSMGRAPRKSTSSAPAVRAALAARLSGVIAKKLEQMETAMERGELKSEDLERDAKAVASMIGGMEKVAATVPDADKKRTTKTEDADGEDNVERLQREIIARFEQIQRRRNAEGGSE